MEGESGEGLYTSSTGSRAARRAPEATRRLDADAAVVLPRRVPDVARRDTDAARREAARLRGELERQQAEAARLEQELEALRRSNAELEEFASVAAHDLKEPLSVAACYLRRLVRVSGDRLGEQGDDAVRGALEALERMGRLADGLLAYARAGGALREHERVDCELIVGQVLANLRLPLEEAGARVTFRDLAPVAGDPLQIFQLFQNLVSNALKFRGVDPPRVVIGTESGPADVVVSVRDNGIGIPEEDHTRVFGVFERLDRDQGVPGTGLGLSICRRIVERHGGRIWIDSAPGRGTTVYFTLRRAGARGARPFPTTLGNRDAPAHSESA